MAGISTKKLADLCHRVGTAYKSGLDIKKIWQREANNGSPRHKIQLAKVAERIAEGQTVAEGMDATDEYFPDLAVAITEAGEQGGRLEKSFELLTKHCETILRFRTEMQTRLAWPLMELFGAVVVIGGLILIMGWLGHNLLDDLLGFGWSAGGYFWAYLMLVLMFFGTLAVAIYGSREGWFGDYPMRIARKIPVLGKTIQIFALARFAWVLSAAYESGMNTMRGVGLAFRSTQNNYYRQFTEEVQDDLQQGKELTLSLRETGAFPEDFIMHVENGELTGNLPESLRRVADEYTAEAERNLSLIAKVMFFVIFGMIAVIIGIVIVSLYYKFMIAPLREFG